MDIKEARSIYNDIWAYHKKYMVIQNDERFLKSMIAEKDEFLKKYSGNLFAKEMIFIVFKSLLASWREQFAPEQ